MVMTKERRPAARSVRGWPFRYYRRPVPSANAKNTHGCRTGPIRMRASRRSKLPAEIRPRGSPSQKRSPPSAKCSKGSVIPVPSPPGLGQ
jgi:hypothetical protein